MEFQERTITYHPDTFDSKQGPEEVEVKEAIGTGLAYFLRTRTYKGWFFEIVHIKSGRPVDYTLTYCNTLRSEEAALFALTRLAALIDWTQEFDIAMHNFLSEVQVRDQLIAIHDETAAMEMEFERKVGGFELFSFNKSGERPKERLPQFVASMVDRMRQEQVSKHPTTLSWEYCEKPCDPTSGGNISHDLNELEAIYGVGIPAFYIPGALYWLRKLGINIYYEEIDNPQEAADPLDRLSYGAFWLVITRRCNSRTSIRVTKYIISF